MCLYPKLIPNRKYIANKKNGGIIPAVNDVRVLKVAVGCQECIECRKQKARGWQVRLLEDIKTNKNGKFVTLTFSNEGLQRVYNDVREKEWIDGELKPRVSEMPTGYDLDNEIAKRAVRRFLERWRKKYKKSLRHWFVTELGHNGTENIHLHGIVWSDDISELKNIWSYGFVWDGDNSQNGSKINYVNERTVNYIVKYVNKADEKHKGYRSKVLTSAGIGSAYTLTSDSKRNKYNGVNTNETYRTRQGNKIAMPTYWRNKIYSEEEREQLWLQKLDKQERWVCGEKVSVAKDHKQYDKLLEFHRTRNKELGYGTGQTSWKQLAYEKERRELMILTRLKAANTSPSAGGLRPEASPAGQDLDFIGEYIPISGSNESPIRSRLRPWR